MPEKFSNDYGNAITSSLRLQLPNGRQFHVQYKKKTHCISNVEQLFREFKMNLKLILVLSYKGDGNFLVNVFNDGLFETEYGSIRTIVRAPLYQQGII